MQLFTQIIFRQALSSQQLLFDLWTQLTNQATEFMKRFQPFEYINCWNLSGCLAPVEHLWALLRTRSCFLPDLLTLSASQGNFASRTVIANDLVWLISSSLLINSQPMWQVYKRVAGEGYKLKMSASRTVFGEIIKKYPSLPFTLRNLEAKNARLGLPECVNHDLLQPYPVLHEKPNALVAHFKATVLLLPNGSDRITSAPVQELKSEKKVWQYPLYHTLILHCTSFHSHDSERHLM